MKFYIFIVFLTLSLVALTHSQQVHPNDYYKKFTKDGEQHTMVKYTGIGTRCNIGGSVTVAKSGTVTADEKTKFLKLHNDYRRKVAKGLEIRGTAGAQPSGSDIRELTWDDELAAFAQRWAEQCPGGGTPHDSNRRNDRWTWVGQNMFSDTDQSVPDLGAFDPPLTANSDKAMQFWSLEAGLFDKANIKPFTFTANTGHYTQLVWADTEKIGCGFFMTKEVKQPSVFVTNYWKRFVVCNFGPGGNINGLSMYKLGAAASACPAGTVANDGLCKVDSTATTAASTSASTTAAATASTTAAAPATSASTTAANGVCNSEQFKCGNGLCIPSVKRCDAYKDCSDGSDESSATCSCSPAYQFQCGNKCIPTFWVCDHQQDCADNSDESDALCKSSSRRCPRPQYEFLCRSGRCIEKEWKCDGLYDCPEGDDEVGC